MSQTRRYDEQEIKAIFKQAAEAQETARGHLSTQEGLTLAELQEIGREAGITPEFIAQAAAGMDPAAAGPPTEKLLGMPVGVSRTVALPRALTDAEWDLLVADLRETFHAQGNIRHDGALRQWKNGNLQINVEPTATGHRLRMSTRKGNARNGLGGGLFMVLFGLILMLSVVLKKGFEPALVAMISTFILAGLGMMGGAILGLPRWANTRAAQMETLAGRVLNMTAGTSPAPLSTPAVSLDALPDMPAEADPLRAPLDKTLQ